jgi:RNA polymerase sigma factor (sigma-70 family)
MPLTKPAILTSPPIEDETMLVAAAQRNPADFARLYDRYVKPVYRYLYSRLGSGPEAEDLTAQTFLSALEALPRYRQRGHFATWLFAIARNKVMDFFRQRKNLPLDETHPAENADLLVQAVHADEIARLAALLRTLDEGERDLIRLRYVSELPFAEIAALLGRKEDTVKKSLYRLLARLQSQME